MRRLSKITLGALALTTGFVGGLRAVLADHPAKPSTRHELAAFDASSASPFGAVKPAHAIDKQDPPESLAAFMKQRLEDIRKTSADEPNDARAAALTSSPDIKLNSDQITQIAERCAPSAPASALVSIARVESGLQPLTIGVNGLRRVVYHPRSVDEAVSLAQDLIARGRNIDLGVAQINSRNVAPLGLSVADAFDPCRNLAAAAVILNRGYERALGVDRSNRPILQMAYSIYNTGDIDRGLANGYVAKVETARRRD